MDIIETVKITMTVFNKLLDRTPTYDQKKKADLAEMERRFYDEVNATVADHALIDKLGSDIMQHIKSEMKNV